MNKNKRWLLQHTNFQTVTWQSKPHNGHCLSPWEHWFCRFSVFIHHNLQSNYHCSNLMKAIIYCIDTLIPEDHRTFFRYATRFQSHFVFSLTNIDDFLFFKAFDKTGIQRLAQKLLMEEEPTPSSHSCPFNYQRLVFCSMCICGTIVHLLAGCAILFWPWAA